jgi:hypothetical protein
MCLLGGRLHDKNALLIRFDFFFNRDTEEMYGEAGVEAGALGQAIRKELWLCKGAEHCQLWDTERAGFESRVVAFLDKFLA